MVIERFYLHGGGDVGSLEELLEKLKCVDDEIFEHHVNEGGNDFANWIEGCLKEKRLANKIRKIKTRRKTILALDKAVNTPARMKKKIISKIKGEILNASS